MLLGRCCSILRAGFCEEERKEGRLTDPEYPVFTMPR